jgi:hypothetical protein
VHSAFASFNTRPAAYAFYGKELQARFFFQRLGVMAPKAAQIAAREKHGGAYTRPVVYRKSLYVEYLSGNHI